MVSGGSSPASRGNFRLTMRGEIGTLYSDWDFDTLFAKDGQPAVCPWRLALRKSDAIYRGVVRPTSRRGGSQPYRLEICFIQDLRNCHMRSLTKIKLRSWSVPDV